MLPLLARGCARIAPLATKVAWCGVLVAAGMLPAGCWSSSRGDPTRLHAPSAGIPADAWPARDVTSLAKVRDATPAELFRRRLREGADTSKLTPEDLQDIREPEYIVTHAGIYANGLLRLFEQPARKDEISVLFSALRTLLVGFEANGRIITSRTIELADKARDDEARARAAQSIASRLEDRLPWVYTSDIADAYMDAGIDVHVPQPLVSPPRGLLIHLQSLAGNPYEPQVIDEFRARGWAILSIQTQTRITTPVPPRDQQEIERLEARLRTLDQEVEAAIELPAAEFRRRSAMLLREQSRLMFQAAELRRGSFQACPDTDLDAVGRDIAREIDNSLAGNAYALETMLDYVAQERPDLRDLPRAVVAFSAGALGAPAGVARVRDRHPIDSVVLIGGGANMFLLSQKSTLTDGGVRVRCGGRKVDRRTFEQLNDAYLRFSKLDPYHTAPALRGIPVLQVHARWDGWVPASGGRLLTQRLESPDLIRFLGGHQALFFMLPGKADEIADWVEAHSPVRGPHHATGATP